MSTPYFFIIFACFPLFLGGKFFYPFFKPLGYKESVTSQLPLKFVGKFETGHLQFLLQNKTGQTYIAALLRKPDGQKIIRFSLFFEIPMTKAAIPTFYDVTSGMLKMAKRSQSISV